MTIQSTHTVQRGVEIIVPLNKLKLSPRNARKTPHSPAEIEAFAASIAAKGLLQPPVVEPERDATGSETGTYLVTIGEGRRQALRLLAKRKRIAKTEPVRCLLDADNDAFEISLDENVTRVAMHPADQFEAFRDLAQVKGWSADQIAVRFGVTPHTVRQRLRLGAVSARLLDLYRAGDLTLAQVMAFAVTEDQARQEQVYDQLSFNRSPSCIRRALIEHEVPASDRRAVFIGVAAYEAAGGRVRRDLFADDQGGWFEDVGLLDRLATEQLTAEAERLRTEEGWAWAEAHLDYPHDHGLLRVYPRAPVHDEAAQGRLKALAEEYDALVAGLEEDAPVPEEIEARLAEIDVELAAANAPVFGPDAKTRGGLIVTLHRQSGLRVDRGFLRPEDAPPAEPDPTEAETGGGKTATTGAETPEGPKPLPDRLVADLSAHRTAALRDALAGQPEVAFLALLEVLVRQTFGIGRGGGCLEIAATHTRLAGHAEGIAEAPATRAVEARHAAWAARLPEQVDELWAALLALPPEDRLALLAHCVSLAVNAVTFTEHAWRRKDADDLAERLSLDMTRYWRATADSYFGRVSKAHILAAVEADKPEAVDRLRGLKKDAMAHAAADLLGAEGWLPPLLRTAAAVPA